MKLSIVTTLYESAAFVREFYKRIVPAAEACTDDFEIVFVNDGSPDDAARIAREIVDGDHRARLLDLSRNFGHHYATLAGLAAAEGDLVFVIDVDLEEQPEWLPRFWSELHDGDHDVVFGVQRERKGPFFKRLSGGLFWRFFNLLSRSKVPPDSCTVRIMRQQYVEALLRLPDRALFLAGNYAWTGFRQKPIRVDKKSRPGRSNYTLLRMLDVGINALVSFSEFPLRVIFYLGLLMTIGFGIGGSYMFMNKVLYPETVFLGWTSMIVSMWFLSGVLIMFVGIIGIYLSKIFVEVKARPLYIVRESYRHKAANTPESEPS